MWYPWKGCGGGSQITEQRYLSFGLPSIVRVGRVHRFRVSRSAPQQPPAKIVFVPFQHDLQRTLQHIYRSCLFTSNWRIFHSFFFVFECLPRTRLCVIVGTTHLTRARALSVYPTLIVYYSTRSPFRSTYPYTRSPTIVEKWFLCTTTRFQRFFFYLHFRPPPSRVFSHCRVIVQ